MIDILKAIVIGIVEGVTEWLPVSSTGHIILTDEFIKLGMTAEFMEMFEVVIQLGAILAVVVIYWHKLWPFTLKKEIGYNYITKQGGYIKKDIMDMWFKVVVACIPAVILVPFNDKIDELFYNYQTVSAMLIIYGILFIIIERFNKKREPKIVDMSVLSYKTAILIGLFQVLAVIPGTSRSGATILGAILLGVSRVTAAEFSFYLAVPVMFGASLIKILDFGFEFTGNQIAVLATGMISAFVVSILAIKFLIGYIKKRDFAAFGYYRIILGIVVLIYFLLIH
ncbi:MAG: undecaprenyl-diphosphate phosphatase [Clostridia bacterium]|nr:undecaprenyl-diphosphate phosphatase [Clostridia bacterium]MEE1185074.1 undecaprenyl-diphosphate phosphatase [Acutalibacteraceae bacterium]